MKLLKLTKGNFAKVDDDVFELVKKHSWSQNGHGYPNARVDGEVIYLHRFILKAPKGLVVDHINQDKLDNRRENLRITTRSINGLNSKISRSNRSGFNGVCYCPERKKWKAYITINYKQKHLGEYREKEDAIKARMEVNKLYDIKK